MVVLLVAGLLAKKGKGGVHAKVKKLSVRNDGGEAVDQVLPRRRAVCLVPLVINNGQKSRPGISELVDAQPTNQTNE